MPKAKLLGAKSGDFFLWSVAKKLQAQMDLGA